MEAGHSNAVGEGSSMQVEEDNNSGDLCPAMMAKSQALALSPWFSG